MTRGLIAALLLTLSSSALAAPTASSLINEIPASAAGAIVVDRSATLAFKKLVDNNPSLRQDLNSYLVKRIGFDPMAVDGVVAWLEPTTPPRGYMLLRGPKIEGALHLPAPFAAIATPGGILVSTSDAINLPRGATTPPGKVARLLSELGPAEIAIAVGDFSWDRELADLAKQFMIDGARAALRSTSITAELQGNPQKLEAIGQMLVAGLAVASQKLREERDRAFANPELTADGLAAVVGFHQMAGLQKDLEPKIVGNRLVFDYKLPEMSQYTPSMIMVAMSGVLAAVAIPAFVKYTKRSKSVEARVLVPQVARLAATYYDRNTSTATLPKFKWPKSSEWDPPSPCCSQPGGVCTGASLQSPVWKLLGVDTSDAQRYQFRFTSNGIGKKASFRVEARGDLNCNGVYSRFWIDGRVGDSGVILNPIQVENELE